MPVSYAGCALCHPPTAHMKACFVAPLLILLSTVIVYGRVAETKVEIFARYGDGIKAGDRLKSTGAETWKYSKAGFIIEVIYINGVSVWEVFKREDRVINDDDIKALLKLYDTPATNWRHDRKEKRWERGGKPKLVAYRWPGHPDYFCIKDVEACDAAEKSQKVEDSGL
jgi:hypothetical protein